MILQKITLIKQVSLLIVAKTGIFVNENELNEVTNNKYNRTLNGSFTLKNISIDTWNEFREYCFINKIYIRTAIINEVEKFYIDDSSIDLDYKKIIKI